MKKNILFIALIAIVWVACFKPKKFVYKNVPNTPAAGFDTEGSDEKAIALADSVMRASGGRYAWDKTRFIRWRFFGKRDLIWDKKEEKVRIDFLDKDLKIRLNLKDMTGSVQINGVTHNEPDSLKKYLNRGKSTWINDSYWLVMPFKMKDSGVTLKYLGKKENKLGVTCEAVKMTFKAVGDTPNNAYVVYISPSSWLITQWDYYENTNDAAPKMSTPWQDYRGVGHIMLAVSRGEGRDLTPLGVYQNMPDSIFTSFYGIDWSKIK